LFGNGQKMLEFFYESLDTLKTVKLPTKKEVINMMLIILAVIVIMGAYFTVVDQIGYGLFSLIHNTLTNLF